MNEDYTICEQCSHFIGNNESLIDTCDGKRDVKAQECLEDGNFSEADG